MRIFITLLFILLSGIFSDAVADKVKLVGSLEQGFSQLICGNGYLYALGWQEPRFYVIDISNPHSPAIISETDLPIQAHIYDMTFSDPYVFLVWNEYLHAQAGTPELHGGLEIIDISNPIDPKVTHHDLFKAFNGISISGVNAYVASQEGLWVIDISDISGPQEVGYCHLPGGASDIDITYPYAFVAGESGFWIVDISNPTRPYQVSHYDLPGDYGDKIAVSGSYAYLASKYGWSVPLQYTFSIVDVSEISNPLMQSSFTQHLCTGMDFVISESEPYAYILLSAYFSVFDISDVANPREVARGEEDQLPLGGASICVSGDCAYIGASSLLKVYDLTVIEMQMTPSTWGWIKVRFK